MKLYAMEPEISSLEARLERAPPGDSPLAVKVALAWHLRQRDSARCLKLSQDVVTLIGGSLPNALADADGGHLAAYRARAALAAGEAAALHCDFNAAERWLLDARANVTPQGDVQAEGDAWLLESSIANARGQREREREALEHGIAFFSRGDAPERLAVARAWAAFERTLSLPDLQALAHLEPPGKAWPEARIAWNAILSAAQALALTHRDPGTAAALYKQASAEARAVGLVQLDVMCIINAGLAVYDLGDRDLAAECFGLAEQRACATGWPSLVAVSDTRIGELLSDLGAFEDSRRVLNGSIGVLATTSRGAPLASACAALARTLVAMGLPEDALAPIGAAVDLHREAGPGSALAFALLFQARALTPVALPHRVLEVLDEARLLIDRLGLHSLRIGLMDVLSDVHHRYPLAPPPDMTLATAALHYAEAALSQGSRIDGWKAGAALYAFLADRWAEAGDHARAYGYATLALNANEQETSQKMRYPLGLLRIRRRAEESAPSLPAVSCKPTNLEDLRMPRDFMNGSSSMPRGGGASR